MVTAQTAWELAAVTGGRFRLGLGTQVKIHTERRYGSPFDPPGPRLREYVLAVKAIFRAFRGEEKLAFDGEFASFSFMPAAWSPGPIDQPDPPVDVAAVNPWMWRMAGEVADGVHVHPLHSVSYLDEVALPNLRAGAERAGRDPDGFVLTVPVLAIVGDTEAERAASAPARCGPSSASTAPRRPTPSSSTGSGSTGLGGQLNALLKQGDLAGQAALLTDEVLDHFTVTATWADLPAALAGALRRPGPPAGGLPRRAAVAPRSVDAGQVGRGRPGPSSSSRRSGALVRISGQSAVDPQDRAGREARGRRREVERGTDDLARLAATLHRHRRLRVLPRTSAGPRPC